MFSVHALTRACRSRGRRPITSQVPARSVEGCTLYISFPHAVTPMRGWKPEVPIQRPRDQCAAVYMRVSTDLQRYSLTNQIQALASYAADHQLKVVDAYADEGKSGLNLRGRPALQAVLEAVKHGTQNFGVLLVLDISRWGRFQNTDEPAHYEFLCLLAGVRVVYTAEPFDNDASPVSAMLKGMKRVMAGEFSRELSRRVTSSLRRMAAKGFHVGGPSVYGMRRVAVDELGVVRGVLEKGQHKSYTSDHVELAPGPAFERKVVRRIFREFVRDRGREKYICARLNAAGVASAHGRPWTTDTIRHMLDNPVYIGKAVYNRTTVGLRTPMRRNPKQMWIERTSRFPPLVRKKLFAEAQAILEARVTRADDESLLQPLRELFARTGRLSGRLINRTPGVPSSWVIQTRFGTLLRAYELAGLPPCRDFQYQDINRQLGGSRGKHIEGVRGALEAAGYTITLVDDDLTLRVDDTWGLSVKLSRAVSKSPYGRRWRLAFHLPSAADFCLVIRMDARGCRVVDYYLFPKTAMTTRMVVLGDQNNVATDVFRVDKLDKVADLVERVRSGEIPLPPFRLGRTLFTRANARCRIKWEGQ
jgi:DNA invertase Pin-like site-specific DNA recombinase